MAFFIKPITAITILPPAPPPAIGPRIPDILISPLAAAAPAEPEIMPKTCPPRPPPTSALRTKSLALWNRSFPPASPWKNPHYTTV